MPKLDGANVLTLDPKEQKNFFSHVRLHFAFKSLAPHANCAIVRSICRKMLRGAQQHAGLLVCLLQNGKVLSLMNFRRFWPRGARRPSPATGLTKQSN